MKTVRAIGLVLLSLIGTLSAPAQETPMRSDSDLQQVENLDEQAGGNRVPILAMDASVDPDLYFVGPGDVFAVNLWISRPVSFTLPVTPEGTLIVPTVGEIPVADETLTKARERVIQRIKSRYAAGGEPTMTLMVPRSVRVTVKGNVLNPGSYTVQAYHRADKAIEDANRVRAFQTQDDIRIVLSRMSRRNIKIIHRDGRTTAVDLSMYEATRSPRWSPYLREGDVVVVPTTDLTRDVIGVYGEVNVQGRFEYVPSDSVSGALRIAHGFTARAIEDSVELVRFDAAGQGMISSILDGSAILEGRAPDLRLHPGDRILVRPRPDDRADYRVTVMGEVSYPGTYPITKDKTRLSEVIRMAGGFTSDASIKTAEVARRSVREEDIEIERLESVRGGVSPEDSLYYYLETDLRILKENVNVDFWALFVDGDSTHDVFLQDRDIIKVPVRKSTIYVFGQVVSPGHIPFVEGRDHTYYIGLAGGMTDRAREDDVKIVKAKTRQWLSPSETVVEEGDYVWIPKETDLPFGYYLAIVGQTAAIVSVALSVVILALQIGK